MTQPTYDPHNPQPLSQMQTELVWEGKYDEYGDRHEVDIASLWQEFKGKVDLIYIDPTFYVGADFSMSVALGNDLQGEGLTDAT